MPASYLPHLFGGGVFDRVFQKFTDVHSSLRKSPKSRYFLSLKACLLESHDNESMKCCSTNCIRPISETILIRASYYDDIFGIEEFEEFYPEDEEEDVYVVLPVCKECSMKSRESPVEIEEDTECIIHRLDGSGILYKYIDHCGEFKSMRINPNNPASSLCDLCNESYDELEFELDEGDDDESISPAGSTIWGIY